MAGKGPSKNKVDAGIIQARTAMVYWARKNLGSTQWNASSLINYSTSEGFKLNFDPSQIDPRITVMGFKCNLFVSDIAAIAGAKTWLQIENSRDPNMPQARREPTAAEWKSDAIEILGWRHVDECAPGDVCSDGKHMGIVSDKNTLISASSVEGKVNETSLPKAKFRRFFGLTIDEVMRGMPSSDLKRRTVRCY